ncbi:acyl-[acyl-carrier-protein]-UDP-N-acetylglucosamine O-acyltransferase [Phytophthora infestans T30-4]|uniref:Acyl-[acyl-carrier-protein]-UDP-N-acetylglucosamine O-acyltransferase n=1 Tax=Phytophthora infestans (strain T30-4) TaxID=403677 RepID=D0N7B6_PHYIT|nr:acyl-[acyl-carrier-protein]-UDP-N-acetylglucosamine O-acyltransferase [Phytophthora infestans T30-4]EEY53465.1 acyl-[acyl-carrier-protein]-UDP-N-acetylglucosamine O-acyltransferase [Phytophthora infestans T30-4]|eukprot:XP_002905083.1 acyl-[acyl-carrier-protein]-UDP-N-acetylglucosamine O-acyltransferase [Phytophthora infestans T30-4]
MLYNVLAHSHAKDPILTVCLSVFLSQSSASAEALEELIAHATQQDERPAGRRLELSRRLHEYQATAIERAAEVHATAVVHPNAELGPNVLVGPYSVIGPDVVLEADVRLQSHVVIDGKTRVGSGTEIHPFASLGGEPQDKKHQLFDKDEYEDWTLTIGSNCVIREHVTVHGSTSYSQAPTSVGDDCWLLCGAHVAHDSQVGRRVVVSNNVCLAGHVSIGDCAVIGGQVGIKQHVSVGPLAMVGGQSAVDGDVLPFGLVVGNRAKLAGLNLVGLRRAGVSRNNIKLLLRVYRYVFGALSCKRTGFAPALEETVVERALEAKQFFINEGLDSERIPMVHEMVDFVVTSPQRYSSLCQASPPH